MRAMTAAVVAAMLMAGAAMADAEAPPRTISVTGTVETAVQPDLVVWRIRLTDSDPNLLEAKKRNDAKVDAVLKLRRKLDLDEADVETGHVTIRRDYERDDRGRRGAFKGFVVSRSVTIRERDLKRFDEFLDALVASAEMEVDFSLEASGIREVRVQTRLRALQVAKTKATQMAAMVGAKLGEVITINEHSTGGYQQPWAANFVQARFEEPAAADVGSDRFAPGAVTVKETVYVTFALE